MKPLLITLGLGGLAAWALTKKLSAAEATSTDKLVEKNGHKWLVRFIPPAPGVVGANNYNVFAPKGSWGPHEEMLVLRYYEAIVPNPVKTLSGVGANVPVAMRDAAMADLGVVPPS